MTGVRDALAAVTDVAGFLRWRVGDGLEPGEIACGDLAGDADLVARTVAESADGRGSDDPQVAASLWWQGYAYRVAGTALACWLLTGAAPDPSAENMAIGIARSRPSSVTYRCDEGSGDVATLVDRLFPGHLDRVAATLLAGHRLGTQLVWGDAAAACAAGAGAVREAAGPAWHEHLGAFLAAAPHDLAGLGAWHPTGEPDGWAYQRRTCCLWWKTTTAAGALCADCSLRRTDAAR
jgi:ferric iron reductase protein FhuF